MYKIQKIAAHEVGPDSVYITLNGGGSLSFGIQVRADDRKRIRSFMEGRALSSQAIEMVEQMLDQRLDFLLEKTDKGWTVKT